VPVVRTTVNTVQDTSKPKHHSEIECGVLRKNGLRVYKLRHKFFGDMEIEVFTAKSDPKRRMLFRPADLAQKLGFPATRIGMYLHRRKSKIPGIFQATNFSYKLTGITGLKTGSYFISLDVCRKIEKDYFQKAPEDGEDDGIEHTFTDDEGGITMEVITEKAFPATTIINPRFVVGSSQVLLHDPQYADATGYIHQPTVSHVPYGGGHQHVAQYSYVQSSAPQPQAVQHPYQQFSTYSMEGPLVSQVYTGNGSSARADIQGQTAYAAANLSSSSQSSSTNPSPQTTSYSYVQQTSNGPVYIVESTSTVPHTYTNSRPSPLAGSVMPEQIHYVPTADSRLYNQQLPPVATSTDLRIFPPQAVPVSSTTYSQQVPALSSSTSAIPQQGQWIVSTPTPDVNFASTANTSRPMYYTR